MLACGEKETINLILYHNPEPRPIDSWGELFDLKNDPGEMNNLSS